MPILWVRAARVARTDHRRVDELVGGIFRNDELAVVELDLDAVARHDVGHAGGEDIGPFLFEE
jgi:hypothetical protein